MNTKRITILGLLGAATLLAACNPDPRTTAFFKLREDGYAGGRVNVYDRSSYKVLGEGHVQIDRIAFLREPVFNADTMVYTTEFMCGRNLYREVGLTSYDVGDGEPDAGKLSYTWEVVIDGSIEQQVMEAACAMPQVYGTPVAGDFATVRQAMLEQVAR